MEARRIWILVEIEKVQQFSEAVINHFGQLRQNEGLEISKTCWFLSSKRKICETIGLVLMWRHHLKHVESAGRVLDGSMTFMTYDKFPISQNSMKTFLHRWYLFIHSLQHGCCLSLPYIAVSYWEQLSYPSEVFCYLGPVELGSRQFFPMSKEWLNLQNLSHQAGHHA